MNPLLKSKLLNLKTKIYLFFDYLVKRLLYFIEFFLFLRFLLKFFGANERAIVVSLIYQGSEILIYPFNFIFPNFFWKWFFIEITTLTAMVFYSIFAFLLLQILKIIFQE